MFYEKLSELIDVYCDGSQKILSNQTNIPTSTINSWFKRGSLPSLSQLIILADFFQCSIDFLAERESDFGIIQVANELTKSEKELLNVFRQANEHGQALIYVYSCGVVDTLKKLLKNK